MGLLGREDGLLKSAFLVAPMKRELAAAIRLDPQDGRPHRILGEIFESLPRMLGGGKRRALDEFKESIQLSPRDCSARLALARTYLNRGKPSQARIQLQAVVDEKNPEDPAEYPEDLKEAQKLLLKIDNGRSRY